MPSGPGSAFAGASVQPLAALDAEVDSDGTLGGELGVDPAGPVVARGKYRWSSVDPTVTGVGRAPGGADHALQALGAYRVRVGGVALCPATGGEVELQRRAGRDTRTTWRVPVGVGLSPGLQPGPSLQVAPFLFPQAVVTSTPGSPGETRTGRVEARLDVGAVLKAGRFYGTAGFRVGSDLEETLGFDRALELTAGVTF